MLYWSSRLKSFLILNVAYFLTLFVRKCLHVLIAQKKKKNKQTNKRLKASKFKILTKPPKSGDLRIADNVDDTRRCPLFKGLTVFLYNFEN